MRTTGLGTTPERVTRPARAGALLFVRAGARRPRAAGGGGARRGRGARGGEARGAGGGHRLGMVAPGGAVGALAPAVARRGLAPAGGRAVEGARRAARPGAVAGQRERAGRA